MVTPIGPAGPQPRTQHNLPQVHSQQAGQPPAPPASPPRAGYSADTSSSLPSGRPASLGLPSPGDAASNVPAIGGASTQTRLEQFRTEVNRATNVAWLVDLAKEALVPGSGIPREDAVLAYGLAAKLYQESDRYGVDTPDPWKVGLYASEAIGHVSPDLDLQMLGSAAAKSRNREDTMLIANEIEKIGDLRATQARQGNIYPSRNPDSLRGQYRNLATEVRRQAALMHMRQFLSELKSLRD